MNIAYYTMPHLALASWVKSHGQNASEGISNRLKQFWSSKPQFAPLKPLRQWLETMEVKDPKLAKLLCQLIPAQCPFERTIQFKGRVLVHIPPLCKLNPVYEEVVSLRFRALCYLADECGEDITPYCTN
ncbi:MAG: Mo-dependent nitrogenase C-terminal domain-containing protein [Lyngbya sp.]|nr:Mo-dependent nitrogenase C-terminal domain-containing protein [Lyngbya sp.]